jgi:hypothetical protein
MVAEMMRKVQSLQMLFELVLEPKFRVTLHVCHAQQQEHHLTESAFVVRTYATRMNITGVQCECVARNDMCFNVDPYVTDVTTECLGAGSGPHPRSNTHENRLGTNHVGCMLCKSYDLCLYSCRNHFHSTSGIYHFNMANTCLST